MKRLVLEILSHQGDGTVLHRTIDSFPSTLGRGYQNDIILPDPHISPQHLRFDFGADGWSVTDLGSENGLIVNDKLFRGAQARLASGDVLRIGHTEIRAFDPQHPVPATQRMQKASPFLTWLSRPLHVWASFAVAVAMATAITYFESYEDEYAKQLAYAAAGTFIFILIWSALWAVAGKLIRHKSRFRSHVALISLAVVANCTVISYPDTYIGFLTNQNWLSMLTTFALYFALLFWLIYTCLALATDLTRRRLINAAGYFSAGLLAGAWALSQAAEMHFSPEAHYPAQLEPYLARLAPTDTLDEFTNSNRKLFESKELRLSDDKAGDKKDK